MLTELLADLRLLDTGHRPRVGVSACLLGRAVRYDGDHKYSARVGEDLAAVFELVEHCPEVGIGLSVPRPPIRVVEIDGEERVRGVTEPERDYTEALRGYVRRLPANLQGFILKARSPSCGLGTTPRHDADGRETGVTDGAFASALRRRFPGLPLCNDSDLDDLRTAAAFTLAVYWRWRGKDTRDLPDAWRDPVVRFLD